MLGSYPDQTLPLEGAGGRAPFGAGRPSRVPRLQRQTMLRSHHATEQTFASDSKTACFSLRSRHGGHAERVGRCPTRGVLPRDGGETAWPYKKRKKDTCR